MAFDREASNELGALLQAENVAARDVRALLARGADPNTSVAHGCRALATAISRGSEIPVTAVAKVLLDAGADANPRVQAKHSPLYAACLAATSDIVGTLLERGAKCEPAHLIAAIQTSSEDDKVTLAIMEQLVAAGCPIDTLSDDGIYSPLIWAGLLGRDTFVRFLLDRGVPVDSTNTRGETALMYASGNTSPRKVFILPETKERIRSVRLLLERGADPKASSKRGLTPLRCATNTGNAAILRLLKAATEAQQPTRSKRSAAVDGRTAAWEHIELNLRACELYEKNIKEAA
jgi:ankyrin repeat protein